MKTTNGRREIALMPELAAVLREHRLRSRHSQDSDFVFATARGTASDGRNLDRDVLKPALKAAKLDGSRFRWHDMRHTFASLLIAQGEDVVYVSKQLGHASPDITLKIYTHLFDARERRQKAAARMSATYGALMESSMERSGGERRLIAAGASGADVVDFPANGD